jgi:hypothetical protein
VKLFATKQKEPSGSFFHVRYFSFVICHPTSTRYQAIVVNLVV